MSQVRQEPKIGSIINTIGGIAEYSHTEIEDINESWDDHWSTTRGEYVLHDVAEHHVYKVVTDTTEQKKRGELQLAKSWHIGDAVTVNPDDCSRVLLIVGKTVVIVSAKGHITSMHIDDLYRTLIKTCRWGHDNLMIENHDGIGAGYVGNPDEIIRFKHHLETLPQDEKPHSIADMTRIVQRGEFKLSIGVHSTD